MNENLSRQNLSEQNLNNQLLSEESLREEYLKTIAPAREDEAVYHSLVRRIEQGALTRDENAASHFCVFFAAHDPQRGSVFLGHHRKSGLWLFNGGHIDQGETPVQALEREIGEEWGVPVDLDAIGGPALLTLTEIENWSRQPCRTHYDIWYFVPVDQSRFAPDAELLAIEYHEIGWLSVAEARRRVIDPSTHRALDLMENSA